MKSTIDLMTAPTGYQPGGYVKVAYADKQEASVKSVLVNTDRVPNGYLISLSWECNRPIKQMGDEVDVFVDAAALLFSTTEYAPLMTMGDANNPVEGVLWRPDQDKLQFMQAEGLGSMSRSDAPKEWAVLAKWDAGRWFVTFEITGLESLNLFKRFGVAIWSGKDAERGGLKSISPMWVDII